MADYFKHGAASSLIAKSFHVTAHQARQLEAALRLAGGRARAGRLENRAETLMRIIRDFAKPID